MLTTEKFISSELLQLSENNQLIYFIIDGKDNLTNIFIYTSFYLMCSHIPWRNLYLTKLQALYKLTSFLFFGIFFLFH